MEGGETKRKVTIELDWEKLLGSDRDEAEPPQLVVELVPAAVKAKKKRKSAEMEDDSGDEQSEHFRGLSDKELLEKIERLKRNFSTFRLPDGGEKYRKSIKRHEDELERRRLQPQKTEHMTEDAFRKELSTLNRCDHQRTRSDGHHSSIERHKGEISSRETPFQCPSSLSIDVDKQILSNGVQKGRCSTSPSNHSKDVLATQLAKKRNSSQAQPSNDLRSRSTVVLVDEDEHETAETTHQLDQDECMKEARIYYPSRDDPEAMEICYSDLECLAPEAYVSSTIMNFYIRYLQQYRYSMRKQVDYQFFNTYFYQKLKEAVRKKNDKEASFAKVRRWWKGVKLFEKAYIFLPIHESLHWSLVIICIPDKEAGRGPIILHLDSLRLHYSKSIFENIRRFLIGEWEFLRKEEAHPDLPIPDKIWDKLPRRIQEKTVEVPQQRNDYDCGLFVLSFIERFLENAPERVKEDLTMFGRRWFKPEEASSLRHTIRDLIKEEFKKAKENDLLLDPPTQQLIHQTSGVGFNSV